MSNSHEQSLDENAVFLPVVEASPEFQHCEKERRAVEKLLSEGPEAFYSSIDTEFSSCFLSSVEVREISSWAQNYTTSRPQVQGWAGEDTSEMEDFSSSYFPSNSDTPTPDLILGWPESSSRVKKDRLTVYSSPPAEGEPPVREVIRRNLQKASKVIAIVTDRLTDGAIIGDLHSAAFRGVPVYIILNQRSNQDSFALSRLRHPNMQVRVLGGKKFCSRMGRMVVGEMKNKFLLVDLTTVIHGSYSLTWTDAHLHRQLITVLSGPVVDLFDREFRVLFAESLPVTDTQRLAGTHVYVSHQMKHRPDLTTQHVPLEHEIMNPPTPPADSLLDWEAMGVFQVNSWNPDGPHDEQEETAAMEQPPQDNIHTHIMDSFTHNGHPCLDERRNVDTLSMSIENTSPVENAATDSSSNFKSTEPLLTDGTPEKRVKCIIKETNTRQLYKEQSTDLHDRIGLDEPPKTTHDEMALNSASKTRERSRTEAPEDKQDMSDHASKMENTPSSKKPLILKVPESENSLSDIIKSFQPQPSSPGVINKGSKTAASELNQPLMDQSSDRPNTHDVKVRRFKAFDLSNLAPAFALMKKRNENLKHQLYNTPKNPLPRERPQSSNYTLDWRKSLLAKDTNQETEK